MDCGGLSPRHVVHCDDAEACSGLNCVGMNCNDDEWCFETVWGVLL